MKRKITMVLAAMMIIMSLAGCANKKEAVNGKADPSDEEKVESIDFMYWNNGADTPDTLAIEEVIKKYEDTTGIKVNRIVVPEGKFYETLDIRIGGNQAPDLVRAKYQVMGKYISAGAFENLDSIIEDETKNNLMDAFKVAVQKDGSYYAMPWHTDTNAILYNKRFFEQAGIEVPTKIEDAWSWDEFLDAARKVQEKSDAKYGFGVRWFNNASYRVLPFLYMNNGSMTDTDITKGNMEDPKSLEFLQFIKTWVDEGLIPSYTPNSSENPDDLFVNGMSAMAITGNYMMTTFDTQMKDEYGVTFMPQVDGKTSSDLGGSGLAVCAKSAKKAEAAKLLNMFLEKENMANLCGKAGFLPVRNDISVDELNYEENAEKMKIFIEQVSKMDPQMAKLETSVNFSELGRVLSDSIEYLMLTDTSPEEVAKSMDTSINDVLK